jgi:hypothetical protein
MVKYYLTNGDYVDEQIIENFHNSSLAKYNDPKLNNKKLIEEWRSRSASRIIKKAARSVSRTVSKTVSKTVSDIKVITKVVNNGISNVVKSTAIVIDPISNNITNTTTNIERSMNKFSNSVISSSLKDFSVIGKELKNFSNDSLDDIGGAYKVLVKLGYNIGDDIKDASNDFANELAKLATSNEMKTFYRNSFGSKFALSIGDVFEDVAESVADAVIGFIDPCFWLTAYLCPLLIHGLILSIQISMGIGTLGTETAKSEGTFSIMVLIIKRMIKEATTGRKGIVSMMAHKLVGSMLTPIIAPMVMIMLLSATADPRYIESISGPMCVLITHALVNYIIFSDSGMSYTYFIVGFIAAFMCSGNVFGVNIKNIPGLEGFVPYFKRSLKFPGLDCSKFTNVKKIEHFTNISRDSEKIISILKEKTNSKKSYSELSKENDTKMEKIYKDTLTSINSSEKEYEKLSESDDILLTEIKDNGNLLGSYNNRTSFDKLIKEQKLPIYIQFNISSPGLKERDGMIYKRYTKLPDNYSLFDTLHKTWSDNNNKFHTDFELFNNINDAVIDKDPWKSCNFNDNGIGFSRDCGPNGNSGRDWISVNCDNNGNNCKYNKGKNNWKFTLINKLPKFIELSKLNSTDIWKDSVGNSNVEFIKGNLNSVSKSSYIKYDDGIEKGFGYLTGLSNVSIKFPQNINKDNWTIVYVTRYNSLKFKGRILQGGSSNWLAGHHGGKAGVSHQNSWINHGQFPEQKSWVFAIEQPNKFIRRSGKHDWELFTGGKGIGADQIFINGGKYPNEYSDFDIAELIIYNRKISDLEIEKVKNYLENKYIQTSNSDQLEVHSGIQNRYNYESFKNGIWVDTVGNKNVKMIQGKLTTVDKSSYVKYNDGIDKGFGYLKGLSNASIEFPQNLNKDNWTIVYVTRYDPSAKYKGRILQGRSSNWLAGHHGGKAGVSHQNKWINYNKLSEQKSWVFAIEQPNKFIRRSGKHDWKLFTGGKGIGADQIFINGGKYPKEKSDFNIAELIIYNRKINDSEIEKVKNYLENKYILSQRSTSDQLEVYNGIQNRYNYDSFEKNNKLSGEYNTRDKFDDLMRSQKLPIYIKFDIKNPKLENRKGMIYKRLTPLPDNFSLFDTLHRTWKDTNNRFNVDFSLYNDLNDAINNNNKWNHCNFNYNNIGFSRDCGPDKLIVNDWIGIKCDNNGENCTYYKGKKDWSFTLLKR